MNYNKKGEESKLTELTERLSRTAMGYEKADLIIKKGTIVNVNTAELEDNKDIAIKAGRIVLVGDVSHTRGENTKIIDASGFYLVPGFLDGHVHVESSMVTMTQFVRAVLPRGTTSIFMDPHEIANVLGINGIKLMIEEASNLPLKTLVTMPSCVPAAPGFEDAGAEFGTEEIEKAMKREEIIGLGEMMNFPGVLSGEKNVHQALKITLKNKKVITGHYSIPDVNKGLQAYTAAGILSCHEGTRKEDAISRMRLGMYAKIREGSAWRDVKENIKAVTENNIDTRFAVLVSDDTHPHTLLEKGHMDHVVKRAIQEGTDPINAIQMATINPAQCFNVDRFMGSISPGRYADILFLKDLAEVKVNGVMAEGKIVAWDNQLKENLPAFKYPDFVANSVNIKDKLTAEDFKIRIDNLKDNNLIKVKANVIEIEEAQVGTRHVTTELPILNGAVETSLDKDVIKVMVMERHKSRGSYGLGFVKGFGIKQGAVASTIAHDSHNLLIIGENDEDMAFAGNVLAKEGGGMVAVKNNKILALTLLKIAGLMSQAPVEEVAGQIDEMKEAWKELGCNIISPFMTMSLLSLPVIPELRITNRGLVDSMNFKFIDVIIE